MDVSVILVSYNTKALTEKAIRLVQNTLPEISLEIIVVDNASRDGSAEMIRTTFPEIKLLESEKNVGFGRANNLALPYVQGHFVLLLNTDAFVEPDTIPKTVSYMNNHPETGILGVKLLGRDGVLQPSCRYFPTPYNLFLVKTGLSKIFKSVQLVDDMTWDHLDARNCNWVPGCYYLMRKEVIESVGLFDPIFFLYSEEVDHCFAAKKAGWKVTYYPDAPVIHIGGESAKTDNAISAAGRQVSLLQIESELLYFRKNHGLGGVLMHLGLSILAEMILWMKLALKRPSMILKSHHLKHIMLYLKTALSGRLGKRALR